MKRFKILFFLLLPFFVNFLDAQNIHLADSVAEKRLAERGEIILEFNHPGNNTLGRLSKFLSVDKVTPDKIIAYANKAGFQKFLDFSLEYKIVDPPVLEKNKFYAEKGIAGYDFTTYPTYQQYDSLMQDFAHSFPDLCRLDTIGYSAGGKLLLGMKISDHVLLDEPEPECMLSSTIHGDEPGGYVLMLRLINYLLTNYGTDSLSTNLIDSLEIWINPLANPDGTYASGDSTVSGSTRFNKNAIDLNRNFPDPAAGAHPDGNEYQPETTAMMNFLNSRKFSISANFHAGAEVVNYPWDTWSRLHPDDDWLQFISREYADTVHVHSSGYMDGFNNGITNGYAWYSITGGRQDYVTYFLQGRETTIELDNNKITSESALEILWQYNYRSLLNYIGESNFGIHGFITDSLTNAPVRAEIFIQGHDFDSSQVFSESETGYFVRLIKEGTYDLEVQAPGYETRIIHNIGVADRQQTRLDIKLKPGGTFIPGTFESGSMNLYPNPVFNQLAIRFHLDHSRRLRGTLINSGGSRCKTVFQKRFVPGWNEEVLYLNDLPDGVYVLLIEGDGIIMKRKLVKTGIPIGKGNKQ